LLEFDINLERSVMKIWNLTLLGLSFFASVANAASGLDGGKGNGNLANGTALANTGLDDFHTVLALYNQATVPSVSNFEMWDGLMFYYSTDESGKKSLYEEQLDQYLTLANIDTGQLGSQIRGQFYHTTDAAASWDDFVTWAQSDIQYGSDWALLPANNGSLVYTWGEVTWHFRGIQGGIVGIIPPDSQGKCTNDGYILTGSACAVIYLYERLK
jgi:hypothetical protein